MELYLNQITAVRHTGSGACYEQYVITDQPCRKDQPDPSPQARRHDHSFTLDGDEYIWTRRPNFSESDRPRFGVRCFLPQLQQPDGGVHN